MNLTQVEIMIHLPMFDVTDFVISKFDCELNVVSVANQKKKFSNKFQFSLSSILV